VLTESAISRDAIDLFAVTRGPGSFTGVRIGLATIQGLALVLGRPVCALSTHEAIAATIPGDVTIVDDAGRGEFYASSWSAGRESAAPHLLSAAQRAEVGGRVVHVAEYTQQQNVAAGAARRALRASREGDLDRFSDATPIYVRLAEAEVKLQQKRQQ
ncbi:MAG TPA: tRNA (adenosine(37)-N6)-threonylcarbamoyltransferase complex dimerization subunit type 1 TsaB, partial [Thermoanaerobaculia bacterium]|nr:tRNA (adenosine(37)-N6)-threonylcarbamoyltransferase complex dimerization subunit type 1 TsaB [Thermoanaerobaculia bacterium]